MEANIKKRVNSFLKVAIKMMTCSSCKQRLTKNVCQCHDGHPVCRSCATTGKKVCAYCHKSFYTNKCVVLDNFAEFLLEAEKLLMLERLGELLECCVCYSRITPDFKLCTMGHAVCNDCWTRMMACPICNSNFSHMTNRLLVDIVQRFPYRCNYYEKGCPIIGNHVELIKHESKCQLREFYCQVKRCFWKGGNEWTTVKHVENYHLKHIRSTDKLKFIINIFKIQHNLAVSKTHFVTYDKRHFWQHFYFADGRIRFITLLLGSTDDARKYKAIVKGNYTSKTYEIFSDNHLDVNTCFNKQHLIAYDITNLVAQKLAKCQTGELVVENECKISIQKVQPTLTWCDWLGLTVLGGFTMYLLCKAKH